MQYFDPEAAGDLQTALEELIEGWPAVTQQTMFGCPSYTAADTLFGFLVTEVLVLTRLPDAARAELEADYETGPFQAGSRTMESWVQVAIADAAEVPALEPYIRASYERALEEAD